METDETYLRGMPQMAGPLSFSKGATMGAGLGLGLGVGLDAVEMVVSGMAENAAAD